MQSPVKMVAKIYKVGNPTHPPSHPSISKKNLLLLHPSIHPPTSPPPNKTSTHPPTHTHTHLSSPKQKQDLDLGDYDKVEPLLLEATAKDAEFRRNAHPVRTPTQPTHPTHHRCMIHQPPTYSITALCDTSTTHLPLLPIHSTHPPTHPPTLYQNRALPPCRRRTCRPAWPVTSRSLGMGLRMGWPSKVKAAAAHID